MSMALSIGIGDTTVHIGDTVRVSQNIREGEKTRVQNFAGVLISIKGGNGERTVTVRKIGSGGIGVERTYPVDLPSLAGVTVVKRASVNRGKLYFLRDREGKSALLLKELKPEGAHGKPRPTRGTGRVRVSPKA